MFKDKTNNKKDEIRQKQEHIHIHTNKTDQRVPVETLTNEIQKWLCGLDPILSYNHHVKEIPEVSFNNCEYLHIYDIDWFRKVWTGFDGLWHKTVSGFATFRRFSSVFAGFHLVSPGFDIKQYPAWLKMPVNTKPTTSRHRPVE